MPTTDAGIPPLPAFAAEPLSIMFQRGMLPEGAHPGLVFDRYLGGWRLAPSGWEIDATQSAKRFAKAWREGGPGRREGLVEAHARLDRALKFRDGDRRIGSADSRLAIGLGADHPLENSLRLDATLGVPVIPGAALKGLCREWAARLGVAATALGRLFGREPGGEEVEDRAGRLVFFDALPESWPDLAVDVINPHLPGWQDALQRAALDEKPKGKGPAPTDNPVPVFLLTVAERARFVFRLVSRARTRKERERDTRDGFELLAGALSTLGVGAKTAVGYGRFTLEGDIGGRVQGHISTGGRPLQVVLWINADRQLDQTSVRALLDEGGAVERVEASLVPADGPPLLHRHLPTTGPVAWDDLFDRIDRVAAWARDLDPGVRPFQKVVHGLAPLPAFCYLGLLISAWDTSTVIVNRRGDGTWDRISAEGQTEHPYFTRREGLPEVAIPDQGFIGVYVSIRGGVPDWAGLGQLAGDGRLIGTVSLVTDQPLGDAEGPSAAREVQELFSRLPGRFPRAQGVVIAINGSAPLAFLVGRAINTRLFRKVLVPNFEQGSYVPALVWPREARRS